MSKLDAHDAIADLERLEAALAVSPERFYAALEQYRRTGIIPEVSEIEK